MKDINIATKKVSITIDENLNKLDSKMLAPKKLADANKLLSRLKNSLPK